MANKITKGFASLSPERRREISAAAGKRAHALGVAHQWTPAEASVASRKGWKAAPKRPRHGTKVSPPKATPEES